jgi:phosphohistidine phosphatase
VKTLFIVRHAKSSWDDPSLSDFDRPLNDRGKRDAPRIGKRLKEKDFSIDLMISSPAKRAYATCQKIAETLKFPKEKIKLEEKLYHANEDRILDIIHKVDGHHSTIMIFGHNPGLTEFVNSLTNGNIFNVPTCGVAACEFQINSWKEVGWGKGELTFYDYPKNKDD